MPPPVLLVHGIMRTSRSMRSLEDPLRRMGFTPVTLDYPSTRFGIPTLADEYLGPALTNLHERHPGAPVSVVAHSMGGLLLRSLVARRRVPTLRRVVLLGTPNHGSEISDRMADWWLYRQLFGPAGEQLCTGERGITPRLPPLPVPTGIIAGDRPLHLLLARLLPRPNDSKVTVASTHLAKETDHLVLHEDHDLMLRKRILHLQVAHFLRRGRFQHWRRRIG